MNESASRDTLTFTLYSGMGSTKYVLFAFVVLIYIATILASVTLMLLIVLDLSLHKPMYMFLFSLILNGFIGSTAVWPMVMNRLLTNIYLISYEECLIQAFMVAAYGACNYSMLTVMAYDRVVSIFKPLQYHTIMTPQRVKLLLFVANFSPAMLVLGLICQSSQLPLCEHKMHKIFCDNFSINNLSCDGHTSKRTVIKIYGTVTTILVAGLPVVLILLSYVKIILLSLRASRNTRKKAFQTCVPHLIAFINFSLISMFSSFYNHFIRSLPAEASVVIIMNYILVTPLLQPIVYGVRTKEIRQSFSRAKRKTVFAMSGYQLALKFASLSVFSFYVTDGLKHSA